MEQVKILDCTLRDGAHINGGKFGCNEIIKIVDGLIESGIEIVELGFLKDGEWGEESTFFNSLAGLDKRFNKKDKGCFSLMLRPDQFSFQKKLGTSTVVQILRIAFYKHHLKQAIECIKYAHKNHYMIGINPINILSYSLQEWETLILALRDIDFNFLAIVDTFGALFPKDILEYCNIADSLLPKNIAFNLHLHENLNLAFALAMNVLDIFLNTRDIIVDTSLYGMGRIPGNLQTEIFASYLNKILDKKYDISHIMQIIYQYIKPLKEVYNWNNSPLYAISAFNGVHRTYAQRLESLGLDYKKCVRIIEELSQYQEKSLFDENILIKIINKW